MDECVPDYSVLATCKKFNEIGVKFNVFALSFSGRYNMGLKLLNDDDFFAAIISAAAKSAS
jgi:hypothetical protein